MALNLGSARQAQSELAAREAARQLNNDAAWKYEMDRLLDGEAVVLRVVGEEPYVYHRHSLSKANGSMNYHTICCAAPGQACPACEVAGDPSKRVKSASPAAAFIVYSTRKMLVKQRQKQDGTTFEKLEPLHVNAQGQHIVKNQMGAVVVCPGGRNPEALSFATRDEGIVTLALSLHSKGQGAGLIALEERLNRQCTCKRPVGEAHEARTAEVTNVGWKCDNCDAPVAFDPLAGTVARCGACRHEGLPVEVVECSANCGNPKRDSLTERYIRVTRRGGGTDTVLEFEPMPASALAPAHAAAVAAKKLDLSKIYASNLQATINELTIRGFSPNAGPSQPQQRRGAPPQQVPPGAGPSDEVNPDRLW